MPNSTDTALARLFSEMWQVFLDGTDLDAFDLEKMIERTGLAEWREATEEDVKTSHLDLEVGCPILCLTAEGQQVRDAGHLKK